MKKAIIISGFLFTVSGAPAQLTSPEVAHVVLGEYNWELPPEPRQTFSIALKGGSVTSAIIAWVEGATLHYVEPNGADRAIPGEAIDYGATTNLNVSRGLRLRLP